MKMHFISAVALTVLAGTASAGSLNVKNADTIWTTTGISGNAPAAVSTPDPVLLGGAVVGAGEVTGGGISITPVVVQNFNVASMSPPQIQTAVTLLTSILSSPPPSLSPAQLAILQTQLSQMQSFQTQ